MDSGGEPVYPHAVSICVHSFLFHSTRTWHLGSNGQSITAKRQISHASTSRPSSTISPGNLPIFSGSCKHLTPTWTCGLTRQAPFPTTPCLYCLRRLAFLTHHAHPDSEGSHKVSTVVCTASLIRLIYLRGTQCTNKRDKGARHTMVHVGWRVYGHGMEDYFFHSK